MPYRTTRQADEDIIDIYVWGSRRFGEEQAERYHAGLSATLDLTADNPLITRKRDEFDPPVRLHPYQSHLIIYLVDEAGVLIVRVQHGRQHWKRHL